MAAKLLKPKRRRRTLETRQQLAARLHNPLISLDEAATLLGVSCGCVRRYCNAGRLVCERTPGGHRKLRFREVLRFVAHSGYFIASPVRHGQ